MKILRYSIIIVLIVLLFSCYWTPQGDVGTLRLEFVAGPSARALGSGSETDARVYLMSEDYTLHTFDTGNVYYEAENIADTKPITIENIPSDYWYILLATGNVSGGTFKTARYGSSEATLIEPGGPANPTSVPITLRNTPVATADDLLGKDFTGVVSLGSTVYAATSSDIYYGGAVDSLSTLDTSPIDDYSINSLSLGKWFDADSYATELWVDTNKGIVPYRGGGFKTDFHRVDVSVTGSRAIYTAKDPNVADSLASVAIFYNRPQGVGGTFIKKDKKDSPSEWEWTDVKELEGTLAPGQDLILDFDVKGDYGYFASPLGAFQMAKDVFDSGADGTNFGSLLADGVFFEVVEGGEPVQILSLDYDASTGNFYLGTVNGVYKAGLNADSVPENPKLIGGTGDYGFTMIAVNGSYAAFVSDYDIFVLEKSSNKLKRIPFYAGLPGRLTSIAWKTGTNVLFVSGSGLKKNGEAGLLGKGGFVSVDMDDVF